MACCFFHQACPRNQLAVWVAEFNEPPDERCHDCPGPPAEDDPDLLEPAG